MLKPNRKFVYCFPFGGFNDALHQIVYNYEYCKKFERKLAIDMRFSDFQDDFGNYFHMDYKVILPDKNSISWSTDVSKLNFAWSDKHLNMVETHRNDMMNFDHTKNYDEQLLIEVNCRITGDNAGGFIQQFPLKKHILKLLKERYDRLPKDYISVHIRNTDYVSNVDQFIADNKHKLEGRDVFLASDNSETIEEFKASVKANIFGFSNIPKFNKNHPRGGGIHRYEVDNKEELNIDSIIDLILLSLGKEYYFGCWKSGYTRSAKRMHQDASFKSYILGQMEQQ